MKLSKRELDVLSCIVIGKKSYKSTAKILNINKVTVSTYVRRMLVKIKCEQPSKSEIYLATKNLWQRYETLTNPSITSQKCDILSFYFMLSLFTFVLTFASKIINIT